MHPPEAETSCSSSSSSHSPSFNSYFNADLAETAARVFDEFVELQSPPDSLSLTTDIPGTADENRESVKRNDKDCLARELIESHNIRNINTKDGDGDGDGDGVKDDEDIEFEFDLTNLVPAGGEIGHIYPVFNRDLLRGGYDELDSSSRPSNAEEKRSSVSQIQPLLKDLFLEEDRDADTLPRSISSSSSSDSEVEELESIPRGTYCVWTAAKQPSPSLCPKSSSTGSASASSSSLAAAAKSKAWKLKDLLRRSKSHGKEGVMLITRRQKKEEEEVVVTVEPWRKSGAEGGRVGRDVKGKGKGTAAREGHDYYYYYYHGKKGGEGPISNNGGNNASNSNYNNNNTASKVRRKSYLPYKRDLVGFFVGPQGIRKMQLPPFS